MAAQQKQIAKNELFIAPLSEISTRDHFKVEEKPHQNLINWFHTKAVICERERTCKTFVALYDDQAVGYISISGTLLEDDIEGMQSTNKFQPQIMMLGKLYVLPDYRCLGVGRQLTQYVIGIATVLDDLTGCIGVLVDSSKDAVDFYKKLGFQELKAPKLRLDRTVRMYLRVPEQAISE